MMLLVRRSNRTLASQLLKGSSKLVAEEQETTCSLLRQARISDYGNNRSGEVWQGSVAQCRSKISIGEESLKILRNHRITNKDAVEGLSTRLFSQVGSINNSKSNGAQETSNSIHTKSEGGEGRDWDTVKEMLRYVKPQGDFHVKARMGAALGLLLGSKALNVQVPFMFKYAGASYGCGYVAVMG